MLSSVAIDFALCMRWGTMLSVHPCGYLYSWSAGSISADLQVHLGHDCHAVLESRLNKDVHIDHLCVLKLARLTQ